MSCPLPATQSGVDATETASADDQHRAFKAEKIVSLKAKILQKKQQKQQAEKNRGRAAAVNVDSPLASAALAERWPVQHSPPRQAPCMPLLQSSSSPPQEQQQQQQQQKDLDCRDPDEEAEPGTNSYWQRPMIGMSYRKQKPHIVSNDSMAACQKTEPDLHRNFSSRTLLPGGHNSPQQPITQRHDCAEGSAEHASSVSQGWILDHLAWNNRQGGHCTSADASAAAALQLHLLDQPIQPQQASIAGDFQWPAAAPRDVPISHAFSSENSSLCWNASHVATNSNVEKANPTSQAAMRSESDAACKRRQRTASSQANNGTNSIAVANRFDVLRNYEDHV